MSNNDLNLGKKQAETMGQGWGQGLEGSFSSWHSSLFIEMLGVNGPQTKVPHASQL